MINKLKALLNILDQYRLKEFAAIEMTIEDAFLAGLATGSLETLGCEQRLQQVLANIVDVASEKENPDQYLKNRLSIYLKFKTSFSQYNSSELTKNYNFAQSNEN
jgi:hypothetical protein